VEIQDWKVYEQYARVENAGLKNAAPIAGGKNAVQSSTESSFAKKNAKANVGRQK